MIKLPNELLGMTDYDEHDRWILKDGATEKQKEVFEEFKKKMDTEQFSDTEINIG